MIKKISVILLSALAVCTARGITISGKVTDSRNAAISAASVILENEGITTTTGTDGSFLLKKIPSHIENRHTGALSHKLTATILNGYVSIDVAKKSLVTITAFTLKGKALPEVRRILNFGTHSIALPRIGTGIHLYRVTSGENQFLLKGFSGGKISGETAVTVQGLPSSVALTRQTMALVPFSDVLTVTAPGYLKFQMTISNFDTSGIMIQLTDSSGAVNCASLPSLPVGYQVVNGPAAAEDFEFDDKGNLISVKRGNLFRTTFGGKPALLVPKVVSKEASGTAILPNGDVVIADAERGVLVSVKTSGGQKIIARNLHYPNGVAVDLQGLVYVSEQEGGRVKQVNPSNGDTKVVARGLKLPNGISFSPDYRYLYICSFGGGTVHRLELDDQRNPVGVTLYADNFPVEGINKGWFNWGWNKWDKDGRDFDGIGVDACGNVYVTEFETAIVWRVTKDKKIEQVVNLKGRTDWIPNLHWGSGIGGWEHDKVYVIDRDRDRVFAVDVGVPGKPMPQFKTRKKR